MKTLITFLLCFICGCACANAAENRFAQARNMFAGYVMDWGKMRNQFSSCVLDTESHTLRGDCSSTNQGDKFFLVTTLATLGLRALVPTNLSHHLGKSNLHVSAHIKSNFDSTVSVAYSF